MKLLTLVITSLFFHYCFARITGNSFCSGGIFYRWGSKGGACSCTNSPCIPESHQKPVLYARKALEAGDLCYKQFGNNEVCRKKCVQTFSDDCSVFYERSLYKETSGRNVDFCTRNFGTSPDCL